MDAGQAVTERTRIAFILDSQLVEILGRHAESAHVSRSEYLERLLEEQLSRGIRER